MMMSLDRSSNGSLQDEVDVLRKRVAELESSSAESDQLRKDLATVQGEKASLELEFMNQMNVLARENSLVVEELEGRLEERSKINRALNEQLQSCSTPEMVDAKIREIESVHQKEIANIIDQKRDETNALHEELSEMRTCKTQLTDEIIGMKATMGENQQETNSLKSRVYTLQAERSQMVHAKECEDLKQKLRTLEEAHNTLKTQQEPSGSQQTSVDSLKRQAEESKAEVTELRDYSRSLESELSETINCADEEIQRLENEVSIRDAEMSKRLGMIRSLESDVEAERKSNNSMSLRLRQAEESFQKEHQGLLHERQQLVQALETERRRSAELQRGSQDGQVEKEYLQLKASYQHLEKDNRTLRRSLETLERTSQELNNVRQRLEGENNLLKENCRYLEKDNHELMISAKKLESENQELKRSVRSNVTQKATIADSEFEARSDRNSDSPPTENREPFDLRATQLIRRLEQNLKREGQHKQTLTAGLKSRKYKGEIDFDNPSKTVNQDDTEFVVESLKLEKRSLVVEVEDLKQKLAKERETIMQLRRECSDIKTSHARSQPQHKSKPQHPSPSSPVVLPLASPSNFRLNRTRPSGSRESALAVQNTRNVSEPTAQMRRQRSKSCSGRRQTQSLQQNSPKVPRQRELQATPKSPLVSSTSVASEGSRIPQPRTPRTPVSGLVQSFERRISKQSPSHSDNDGNTLHMESRSASSRQSYPNVHIDVQMTHQPVTNQPMMHQSHVPSTIVVGDVRRDQQYDLRHLNELEEELSRQCEVNCSLMKEISTLTKEAETSRMKEGSRFEHKSYANQKEIERLSSEISRLRAQISQSEESRLNQSQRFEQSSVADRREIDMLKSHIEQLEKQVAEAHEEIVDLQKKNNFGREEISRLRGDAEKLNAQLADAHEGARKFVEELDENNREQHEEIEELQSQLEQLKLRLVGGDEIRQQLDAEKKENERLESVIVEMRGDLADIENVRMELATKTELVEGLETSIQDLKSRLVEAEDQREKIRTEHAQDNDVDKLKVKELNLKVDDLATQLAEAEEKREKLSDEYSQNINLEKEQVKDLETQVENLKTELTQMTESRDAVAENERLQEEEFNNLRKQVDQKVGEFEETRRADVIQIDRLSSQVESLQGELDETLTKVEDLKTQIQDKEGVEATLEELSRMNQRSLDSQINKLQTQLTKTQVEKSGAETDYSNKIKELQATIDTMAVESEQTLEENEKELKELKQCVDMKNGVIERLEKEKDQLVFSMNNMSSSRKDEMEELQVELMEMSTKAADQAREVQALKLQIEESGFQKESVENLRLRVRELEAQLIEREGSRMHEKTALEVENSDLRQRLREISIERQKAEEKLSAFVADKGSSKSIQVLRERNAALKFEVEKLTKKLKKFSEIRMKQEVHVEPTRFMI